MVVFRIQTETANQLLWVILPRTLAIERVLGSAERKQTRHEEYELDPFGSTRNIPPESEYQVPSLEYQAWEVEVSDVRGCGESQRVG